MMWYLLTKYQVRRVEYSTVLCTIQQTVRYVQYGSLLYSAAKIISLAILIINQIECLYVHKIHYHYI